ncbi:hypothetical protein [Streptomyces sp. PT12]|uniref:hypothetical protein n=1 Tax=Streptomyces sp. PT12 TaxID=1510197 RepID=UPI0015EFD00A|nr:hypothetical protein [Streptomyces sp. PT12]
MNTQDQATPPHDEADEGESRAAVLTSEELAVRWAELNKQIDAHLEELRRK